MDLRNANTLLSEVLAPHVPDGRSASEPGVYALEIATPDAGLETHTRWWDVAGYEHTPPYLDELVEADHVLYIGRSTNVRSRIAEHLKSDVRKATLPTVYEVKDVHGVQWGTNSDHAERSYADDLRHETPPETFVHTR